MEGRCNHLGIQRPKCYDAYHSREREPMAKRGEVWADHSLGVFLAALWKLAPAYIIIAIVGLTPLIVVGWSAPSGLARVAGVGAMAGAAAFVAGSLIGFLFGVP